MTYINNLRFSEYTTRGTRESLALKQKIVPFNTTLSATENMAANLIDISTLERPSVNYIRNGNFESFNTSNEPTSWVRDLNAHADEFFHSLSAASSGGVTPAYGTYYGHVSSFIQVSGDLGIYQNLNNIPAGNYTFSFSLRNYTAGASSDFAIRTFFGDPATEEGNYTGQYSLTGDWVRHSFNYTFNEPITENLRFNLWLHQIGSSNAVAGFRIDGVQMEPSWRAAVHGSQTDRFPSSTETPFVQPGVDRNSYWLGTANDSISVREPNITEIHKVVITNVSAATYIDFDRTASSTASSTSGILIPASGSFNEKIIVKDRISASSSTASAVVRGYVIGI